MKIKSLCACLVLLFAYTTIQASQEGALCAVSSLMFHVSENASEIAFTEKEVARLWKKAAYNAEFRSEIKQAKAFYYDTRDYFEVKSRLKAIWNRMNPYAPQPILTCRALNHKNFANNICIDQKMHTKIKPYLLPLNHCMKAPLDSIFHAPGVNHNLASLKKSGFEIVSIRPHSYVIIARHPQMPGYLLKLYLENESRLKMDKPGWQWLQQRCEGAKNVRNFIQEHKLTHFVVPDKWIYPLPQNNCGSKTKCGQPLVLLVTEMNLVSDKESEYMWKNAITHEVLDELYLLMSHGLASRYLCWNLPPTKEGKFACIDTEHPKEEPHYDIARTYLSLDMARYWDILVRRGGPAAKSKS